MSCCLTRIQNTFSTLRFFIVSARYRMWGSHFPDRWKECVHISVYTMTTKVVNEWPKYVPYLNGVCTQKCTPFVTYTTLRRAFVVSSPSRLCSAHTHIIGGLKHNCIQNRISWGKGTGDLRASCNHAHFKCAACVRCVSYNKLMIGGLEPLCNVKLMKKFRFIHDVPVKKRTQRLRKEEEKKDLCTPSWMSLS